MASCISRERALEIAHSSLGSEDLVIIPDATQEFPWGWVFHYNAERHVETGEPWDSMVGNAPMLVERSSGRLIPLGTAHPTAYYIENYLATGDPHTEAGRTVSIVRAAEDARTRSAVQALRDASDMRLAEAKRQIEACLDGSQAEVVARDTEAAVGLVDALTGFGFEARRVADRKA